MTARESPAFYGKGWMLYLLNKGGTMGQLAECELLENCGYFKKYKDSKELACRGFIHLYCRGAKMSQCKRKMYRIEHGEPPPDDMLPTGSIVRH